MTSRSCCSPRTGSSGFGAYPTDDEVDADLINAGKETVTVRPARRSSTPRPRFGMIRGGKIDAAILGAMQVSATGDIANWMIPGKMVKGMGGAMDLVHGAKQRHRAHGARRQGRLATRSSTSARCPTPGRRVVDRIITDLCVLDVTADGLRLVELAPGVTRRDVRAATEPPVL